MKQTRTAKELFSIGRGGNKTLLENPTTKLENQARLQKAKSQSKKASQVITQSKETTQAQPSLFRPLIATSLALALGASVAVANPEKEWTTAGEIGTDNNQAIQWEIVGGYLTPAFKTESGKTTLENLNFKFGTVQGFEKKPDNTATITFGSETSTFKITNTQDKGIQIGSQGTGTLTLDFNNQSNKKFIFDFSGKTAENGKNVSFKGNVDIRESAETSAMGEGGTNNTIQMTFEGDYVAGGNKTFNMIKDIDPTDKNDYQVVEAERQGGITFVYDSYEIAPQKDISKQQGITTTLTFKGNIKGDIRSEIEGVSGASVTKHSYTDKKNQKKEVQVVGEGYITKQIKDHKVDLIFTSPTDSNGENGSTLVDGNISFIGGTNTLTFKNKSTTIKGELGSGEYPNNFGWLFKYGVDGDGSPAIKLSDIKMQRTNTLATFEGDTIAIDYLRAGMIGNNTSVFKKENTTLTLGKATASQEGVQNLIFLDTTGTSTIKVKEGLSTPSTYPAPGGTSHLNVLFGKELKIQNNEDSADTIPIISANGGIVRIYGDTNLKTNLETQGKKIKEIIDQFTPQQNKPKPDFSSVVYNPTTTGTTLTIDTQNRDIVSEGGGSALIDMKAGAITLKIKDLKIAGNSNSSNSIKIKADQGNIIANSIINQTQGNGTMSIDFGSSGRQTTGCQITVKQDLITGTNGKKTAKTDIQSAGDLKIDITGGMKAQGSATSSNTIKVTGKLDATFGAIISEKANGQSTNQNVITADYGSITTGQLNSAHANGYNAGDNHNKITFNKRGSTLEVTEQLFNQSGGQATILFENKANEKNSTNTANDVQIKLLKQESEGKSPRETKTTLSFQDDATKAVTNNATIQTAILTAGGNTEQRKVSLNLSFGQAKENALTLKKLPDNIDAFSGLQNQGGVVDISFAGVKNTLDAENMEASHSWRSGETTINFYKLADSTSQTNSFSADNLSTTQSTTKITFGADVPKEPAPQPPAGGAPLSTHSSDFILARGGIAPIASQAPSASTSDNTLKVATKLTNQNGNAYTAIKFTESTTNNKVVIGEIFNSNGSKVTGDNNDKTLDEGVAIALLGTGKNEVIIGSETPISDAPEGTAPTGNITTEHNNTRTSIYLKGTDASVDIQGKMSNTGANYTENLIYLTATNTNTVTIKEVENQKRTNIVFGDTGTNTLTNENILASGGIVNINFGVSSGSSQRSSNVEGFVLSSQDSTLSTTTPLNASTTNTLKLGASETEGNGAVNLKFGKGTNTLTTLDGADTLTFTNSTGGTHNIGFIDQIKDVAGLKLTIKSDILSQGAANNVNKGTIFKISQSQTIQLTSNDGSPETLKTLTTTGSTRIEFNGTKNQSGRNFKGHILSKKGGETDSTSGGKTLIYANVGASNTTVTHTLTGNITAEEGGTNQFEYNGDNNIIKVDGEITASGENALNTIWTRQSNANVRTVGFNAPSFTANEGGINRFEIGNGSNFYLQGNSSSGDPAITFKGNGGTNQILFKGESGNVIITAQSTNIHNEEAKSAKLGSIKTEGSDTNVVLGNTTTTATLYTTAITTTGGSTTFDFNGNTTGTQTLKILKNSGTTLGEIKTENGGSTTFNLSNATQTAVIQAKISNAGNTTFAFNRVRPAEGVEGTSPTQTLELYETLNTTGTGITTFDFANEGNFVIKANASAQTTGVAGSGNGIALTTEQGATTNFNFASGTTTLTFGDSTTSKTVSLNGNGSFVFNLNDTTLTLKGDFTQGESVENKDITAKISSSGQDVLTQSLVTSGAGNTTLELKGENASLTLQGGIYTGTPKQFSAYSSTNSPRLDSNAVIAKEKLPRTSVIFTGSNQTLRLYGDLQPSIGAGTSAKTLYTISHLQTNHHNVVIDLAGGADTPTRTDFRLLAVGFQDVGNKIETITAGDNVGFSGNGSSLKLLINQDATTDVTLGGEAVNQTQDGGKLGHAYSDRVIVGVVGDNTTTYSAKVDIFPQVHTLKDISHKGGGTETQGNIALLTVKNNDKGQALIDLQAQSVVVGDEIIEADLVAVQTSADGKANTNQQNSDYTTYFLGKAVSKGATEGSLAINAVAASLNYDLFLANFNSLNKRMGELRNNPNDNGIWARVFGGMLTSNYGVKNDIEYITTQAGYDYGFDINGEARNYLGLALSYATSKSQSEKFTQAHLNTANDQVYTVSLDGTTSQGVEVALYNSYVSNVGWYSDTLFKFSYIMSDFTILSSNTTRNSKSQANNFGFVFSEEVGYRFKLGKKKEWFIDPQVELGFGYLTQNSFSRDSMSAIGGSYTTSTILQSVLNLRTRVGSAFGYEVQSKQTSASIYVGAFYEFDYVSGGDAEVISGSGAYNQVGVLSSSGRAVLNVGSNISLQDHTRLYFDVEKSFGDKLRTHLQFNAGVRYSFGNKNPKHNKENLSKELNAPRKIEAKKGE